MFKNSVSFVFIIFASYSSLCESKPRGHITNDILIGGSQQSHFDQLLDVFLIPRPVDSDNLKSVRKFISDTLSNLGWTIELDDFNQDTIEGPHNFVNIITRLNPTSPKQIVLACHYDTLKKIEGFVGAIDAAVPCVILLQLAANLTPSLRKLNESDLGLTLVFFDGEEGLKAFTSTDSLYGSKHLAERWSNELAPELGPQATQLDRIDLFVLLDLIGTTEPEFFSFAFDGADRNPFYDRIREIEIDLNQTIPSQLKPMFRGKFTPYPVTDDHTPFVAKGLTDILHIITKPFPNVWHSLRDNRDALDFDYIHRFALIFEMFIAEMFL